MRKFALSMVALAGLALSTQADAAITISEAQGNLVSLDWSVDEASRTITINETWGENTLNDVRLLIEGWPYGYGSWTINKYVTNQTGSAWSEFSHELLQADQSASHDKDGLSFAQLGAPLRDRESDLFSDSYADELSTRDFLDFFGGTVENGQTVWFSYGITNRRDTGDTNPFYLRQYAAGAVPEPATWAMLIMGFGLVGMSARRRRQSADRVSA